MQCPLDGTTLVISERQGVEIDYCPQCRGVWLDRGELDKILDRAAEMGTPERLQATDENRSSYRSDDNQPHGKRRKRESFLSDIFDFGD